jgi:hypothetical protein
LRNAAKGPVANGNERGQLQPVGIFFPSSRNFARPMSVSGW